jgi:pSer/pThr/pTyr-binding forkhead associated (FHA) protein
VRVNGEPLRGRRALAPGDRVELGSTEVVFEVS